MIILLIAAIYLFLPHSSQTMNGPSFFDPASFFDPELDLFLESEDSGDSEPVQQSTTLFALQGRELYSAEPSLYGDPDLLQGDFFGAPEQAAYPEKNYEEQEEKEAERVILPQRGLVNQQQNNAQKHVQKKRKSYVCPVCQLSCPFPRHLADHMKTHTGEKPHVCAHCPATFAQKGSLKRHMKTHTEKVRFVCPMCSRMYARQDGLKEHIDSKHRGFKKHACPDCPQTFSRPCHLKKHMLTTHSQKRNTRI